MQCLATSTLCGRDGTTIIPGQVAVKFLQRYEQKGGFHLVDSAKLNTELRSGIRSLSPRMLSTAILCHRMGNPGYSRRRNIITNGIAPDTSDSIAVIAVVITSGPGVPFASNP